MLGSARGRPDVDDAVSVDVDDARTPDAPGSIAGDNGTGGQPDPPRRASVVVCGHAGMVATRATDRARPVPTTAPALPACAAASEQLPARWLHAIDGDSVAPIRGWAATIR